MRRLMKYRSGTNNARDFFGQVPVPLAPRLHQDLAHVFGDVGIKPIYGPIAMV